MNLIEVSNKVDNIVDDLFLSMRKEHVENVFRHNRTVYLIL